MHELRPGDKLIIERQERIVDTIYATGVVVLKDHFQRLYELPMPTIIQKIEAGTAEIIGDHPGFRGTAKILAPVLSEKQQARVDKVWPFVEEYARLELKSLSKATLEELRDTVEVELEQGEEKPSISTIYRAIKKYKNSSSLGATAIAPDFDKCGNRMPRYPAQVYAAIDDAVDYYLKREKPTLVQAQCVLVSGVAKRMPSVSPKKIPSSKLVSRRIDSMDARVVARRRDGSKAAKEKFARVHKKPRPTKPLEFTQLDHTPIHSFLEENLDPEVFGEIATIVPERCTLSKVVDVFSNSILGFHLSYGKESSAVALEAVRHAVMFKGSYVDAFRGHPEKVLRPKNDWPMYGFPTRVKSDNGVAHKSDIYLQSMKNAGISPDLTLVGNPRSNGSVERSFRTLNQLGLASLPGATFSNSLQRGDYDSVTEACFGIEYLEAFIVKVIVDIHHQRKQKALGNKSPQEKWIEGVEALGGVPILRSRDDLFNLIGYRYQDQVIHPLGVNVEGMWFGSDELNALMRDGTYRCKKKVEVRLDHRDLTFAYVVDQEIGEVLEVPNIQADLVEGLTLNNVRAARMAQNVESTEQKIARFNSLADAGDLYLAASKGFGKRRKSKSKTTKAAKPSKRDGVIPLHDPEWNVGAIESDDAEPQIEDITEEIVSLDEDEIRYVELRQALGPLVGR